MAANPQNTPPSQPIHGQVINHPTAGNGIPFVRKSQLAVPQVEDAEIRTEYIFGLIPTPNRQDLASANRKREEIQLGQEIRTAEHVAFALEKEGVEDARDLSEDLEAEVDKTVPNTLTAKVIEALASEGGSRTIARHRFYMETYDAGASTILHKR